MMINSLNRNEQTMNIAAMLAEDTGAPELRNPLNSGMRARGLLRRLFGRKSKAEC